MVEFTPVASAIGGILIGLAAGLLYLFNGKISGVSGILGSATIDPSPWRAAFLGGLVFGGIVLNLMWPTTMGAPLQRSYAAMIIAGVAVGFGTQLGGGCTSGHGVCGISRGAGRSVAATLTFMAVGMLVVLLVRTVAGGSL